MATFGDFMAMEKPVSRWLVSIIFLIGMFCGAALAVLFMWSAVLV